MTGMSTASDTAAVMLAVEPGLGAVAIHRRQQDLAGAARLRLARPLDSVAGRIGRPAADEDAEAVTLPLDSPPLARGRRLASMATMTAWLP